MAIILGVWMGIISLITEGSLTREAAETFPPDTPMVRDIFAPNFEIIVRTSPKGGQKFALDNEVKQFITEISFEENVDQFDRMTIKFENQIDSVGERVVNSLIDSKLFAEGHILELKMGYGNSLFSVGAGVVVKKTPDFPADGKPSLTIEAYDLLFLASRRVPRGGDPYKESRDSEIARTIGERNGFQVNSSDARSFQNITETPPLPKPLSQPVGMNDYKFLRKRADINGFELFSKFDSEREQFILFFRPPPLRPQKETFTFVYGEPTVPYANSLISFTPTLNAYDTSTDFEIFLIGNKKFQSTTFKASDRLNAQTQKELRDIQERRIGGSPTANKPFNEEGIQVGFKAFGASFTFPPHKRFKDEKAVRTAIQEFIKRRKENFVTGSGVIVGNETLQARHVILLKGISKELEGKYYLTQVTHRMNQDSAYFTEFQCRKVIQDEIVQAPPALALSTLDEKIRAIKGLTRQGSV